MSWQDAIRLLHEALDVKLFEIAGTPITPSTLVIVAVILAATSWGSRMLQAGIARAFKLRGVDDVQTLGLAQRLTHYAALAVGLGIALQTVGIDLGVLFAAGAVFAVGIGFAMQNIAQNFVSGIILLLEQSIRPGDVLEVDGRMVRVDQMGIRCTHVRTLDGEMLIVPNTDLAGATVCNYTLERRQPCRVRGAVGVSYGSDMRAVRAALEAVAAGFPAPPGRAPQVQMVEFADSAVNFEVYIWIEDAWDRAAARSALNEAIWWALKDAGIEIAFPQLDVHLDGALSPGRPDGG